MMRLETYSQTEHCFVLTKSVKVQMRLLSICATPTAEILVVCGAYVYWPGSAGTGPSQARPVQVGSHEKNSLLSDWNRSVLYAFKLTWQGM